MRVIAEGVYLLEGNRGCNIYLLVSDDVMALVDTGQGSNASQVASQIELAGLDPSDLGLIVITHAHPDHIGGLAALADRLGADILSHRLEAPVIEGRTQLPARTGLQKAMNWIGRRGPQATQNPVVACLLEDGDCIDGLDLRVIHTPGHTPGSICLFQESTGVLLCGDLLFNGNPLTRRGGLRYAPRVVSVDPDQVIRSAKALSPFSIRALCMGHGDPLIYEKGVTMGELLKAISS
jgi:glyoxylase-like metal-dependent hydrolase (beta-lactamase superfamily II)